MKLTATIAAAAILATASVSHAGGFGGINVLGGNALGVRTGHVTVAPNVGVLNGGILNGANIANGSLNGVLSGNDTGIGLGILNGGRDGKKKRRKHRR